MAFVVDHGGPTQTSDALQGLATGVTAANRLVEAERTIQRRRQEVQTRDDLNERSMQLREQTFAADQQAQADERASDAALATVDAQLLEDHRDDQGNLPDWFDMDQFNKDPEYRQKSLMMFEFQAAETREAALREKNAGALDRLEALAQGDEENQPVNIPPETMAELRQAAEDELVSPSEVAATIDALRQEVINQRVQQKQRASTLDEIMRRSSVLQEQMPGVAAQLMYLGEDLATNPGMTTEKARAEMMRLLDPEAAEVLAKEAQQQALKAAEALASTEQAGPPAPSKDAKAPKEPPARVPVMGGPMTPRMWQTGDSFTNASKSAKLTFAEQPEVAREVRVMQEQLRQDGLDDKQAAEKIVKHLDRLWRQQQPAPFKPKAKDPPSTTKKPKPKITDKQREQVTDFLDEMAAEGLEQS